MKSVLIKNLLIAIIICMITTIIGCTPSDNNTEEKKEDNVFYRVDVVGDAVANEKLELALYEKQLKIAENCNPYDYNEIKVVVSLTSPSGKVINQNAFWYQDYGIQFNQSASYSTSGISGVASTDPNEPQGLETVHAIGDPHFRVRFNPSEVGTYKYVVNVYKLGSLVSTEHEGTIEVKKGTKDTTGVLEVDPTNKRTFRFSASLNTFVTVGQNTCWYTSSTRKTEDYGVWFENMAENNMNTTRIWMATWGFCLHWNKSYTDFTNAYAAAARLDKMVEYAEQYNIYFMLCMLNHGQFSTLVNAEWNKNPYNVDNGGILSNPYLFFTDAKAKIAYKNELLYILARYGYSTNVLSWELFNEVDWTDNYTMTSNKVKQWHNEMSSFIKENDPYHHMVSTSYKGTDGNAFGLTNIDFCSPHDYSYTNKNMLTSIQSIQSSLTSSYDKPVFFGEIGVNASNGITNYNTDPEGTTLHQAMWGGMMMGGAGGAMNWWWDSYVHPYDLYHKFVGAGTFAKLMNLSGSDYQLLYGKCNISNSNLSVAGYVFNDRAYGYIYDKSWTYFNTSLVNKNNVNVTMPITAGDYTVTFYNTDTGLAESSVNVVSNGSITFSVPSVKYDIAFIVSLR